VIGFTRKSANSVFRFSSFLSFLRKSCNNEAIMAKARKPVAIHLLQSVIVTTVLRSELGLAVVTPVSPQLSFLPGIGLFTSSATVDSDGIRLPRSQV
jgi:hypothetical protein